MEIGTSPFTVVLLLLLAGVDCSLMTVIVSGAERSQPILGGGLSLHDTLAAPEKKGPSPEDVPPDFFCHSCQEVSRKAEEFLADPSLYEEANNLSSEVCQIVHSNLQIKCRKLVELYLHEGILFLQILFREKNLCNSTGFCLADGRALPFTTCQYGNEGGLSSIGPRFVSIRRIGNQLLMRLESRVLSRAEQYSPLKAKLKSKTCNACHFATDQISRDLEDHDQQMLIMQSLLDVCDAFRGYADKCKLWVFEYGPLFLANLHKFLMNQDLCRLMRMCEEPAPPERKADHLFLRSMEYPLAQIRYTLPKDIAV